MKHWFYLYSQEPYLRLPEPRFDTYDAAACVQQVLCAVTDRMWRIGADGYPPSAPACQAPAQPLVLEHEEASSELDDAKAMCTLRAAEPGGVNLAEMVSGDRATTLSRDVAQRALQSLRRSGRLRTEGTGRWTRYFSNKTGGDS